MFECANCKTEFNSMNWYKISEPNTVMVLCDDCLKVILKERIKVYQARIYITKEQLKFLKEAKNGNTI